LGTLPLYSITPCGTRTYETWRGGDGNEGNGVTGLEERLYYTTDANQNVTALVDTGGDVVERYVYDPYGQVTILDGTTGGQTEWAADADQKSDVDNAILYCGYYRDSETGLYHVRNRVYNAAIGGWLQRDPLGYADGISLYEYCRGMPASAVDPTGTVFIADIDTRRPGRGRAQRAFVEKELQKKDPRVRCHRAG
jgi:RHS repeat-associated protein